MKPTSKWNIFARMGFLETHVKSLNLDGMNMAILEARLDNLMARVARIDRQMHSIPTLYESLKEPAEKKQRVKPAGRPKAKDKAEEKILKRRAYAREYYLRTKRKKEQA
jgi:hypothetical protein